MFRPAVLTVSRAVWLMASLWFVWLNPSQSRAAGPRSAGDFFADPVPFHLDMEVSTNHFASLNTKSRNYAPALIRVGNGLPVNAGIRLRGMSSFQSIERKPAFALKLTEPSSRKMLGGLAKLLFNNTVSDNCCPREALACSLFRAAGVPAARTRLVRVSLNHRDLGMYLAVEAMNKDFLREHFGNDSGNLYEGVLHDVDEELELDNGRDTSKVGLQQLLAAAREPGLTQRWERLNQVLDVDRFLKFAAVQVLLGHRDGYLENRNNYRIYQDPNSGRMTFIPHGLDSVFIRGGDMTPPTNSIVMRALWSIPEARGRYLEVCRSLITNVWQVSILTNQIKELSHRVADVSKAPMPQERRQSCADFLISQVVGRHQEVQDWLSEPEPKLLTLLPGSTVKLTNWSSFTRSGSPGLFVQTNSDDLYLRIDAPQPAVAGWRSRAIIPEGDYVFSCKVRAVLPSHPASGQMPALMVRLAGDLGGATLTSFGEWMPLNFRFLAPSGGRNVEFLCEMQAGSGDIWVDLNSISLKRQK